MPILLFINSALKPGFANVFYRSGYERLCRQTFFFRITCSDACFTKAGTSDIKYDPSGV